MEPPQEGYPTTKGYKRTSTRRYRKELWVVRVCGCLIETVLKLKMNEWNRAKQHKHAYSSLILVETPWTSTEQDNLSLLITKIGTVTMLHKH